MLTNFDRGHPGIMVNPGLFFGYLTSRQYYCTDATFIPKLKPNHHMDIDRKNEK